MWQKHCQRGLKRTEKMGQNEGRLLDFRDSIERDKKSFPTLNMHYSSQKGKNDLEGNSETIRSGMPTTDPGDKTVFLNDFRRQSHLLSFCGLGWCCPVPRGKATPQSHRGETAT